MNGTTCKDVYCVLFLLVFSDFSLHALFYLLNSKGTYFYFVRGKNKTVVLIRNNKVLGNNSEGNRILSDDLSPQVKSFLVNVLFM